MVEKCGRLPLPACSIKTAAVRCFRVRAQMVLQHYLPIRCFLATAVLPSLLVGPVARAESPQLLPTRDVDITYDVTLPSQPRVRERVRWRASELLERVDGPHKSTTIFNRRTREIILLSSAN